MLRKKEEKKEKVKDEAYYAKMLQEVHAQRKNIFLIAIACDGRDDTYQLWSSESNHEEMCHPTHGLLFTKMRKVDLVRRASLGKMWKTVTMKEWSMRNKRKVTKRIWRLLESVVSTPPKSPMTTKVRDLLVSLNIHLNSYHTILCDFDETFSYLNDMLIQMNIKVEKSKAYLYEA